MIYRVGEDLLTSSCRLELMREVCLIIIIRQYRSGMGVGRVRIDVAWGRHRLCSTVNRVMSGGFVLGLERPEFDRMVLFIVGNMPACGIQTQ